MNCLLDRKYVFSYFRSLAKFVTVPSDILDRSIVEYRSENDAKAEMRMRILPGETEYHTEEMKCMYCNIFVKQKVLFSGETWEYDIYEKDGEKRNPKKHGSIRNPERKATGSGSRFDCLDDLTVKLREGDEKALKPEMEQFIMQEETAARLFGLM